MALDLKELQDIAKNVVRSEPKHEIIEIPLTAKNETNVIAVPFRKWRVRGIGFVVTTGGVSTENPIVYFGTGKGDLDAAWENDLDAFFKLTQDTTANKEFIEGDCYVYDPYNLISASKALNGVGSPTEVLGSVFDIWHENVGLVKVNRPNDHNLTVAPFILVEVQIK